MKEQFDNWKKNYFLDFDCLNTFFLIMNWNIIYYLRDTKPSAFQIVLYMTVSFVQGRAS